MHQIDTIGAGWTLTLAALILILTPCLTYLLTSLKSTLALSSRASGKTPPIMPYWIPFLGNLLDFMKDAPAFAAKITQRFGFSVPVRVRFGPFKAYYVSSPSHFAILLKGARNLNSTPGLNIVLQTFFDLPRSVANFYSTDVSGIGPVPLPGSEHIPPHQRVNHLRFAAAQQFLHGKHLDKLTTRFVELFHHQITADTSITVDWNEKADFVEWIQTRVFSAATTSLCGPHFLRLNPGFCKDFWDYITDLPILFKGTPRWWNPKAYEARDRCIAGIMKWHTHAWQRVDHDHDDDESIEWEEYFGARIMRVRYQNFLRTGRTTPKSRAAEDLGMIFAANANAIPATIYFILEFLRSPSLLSRAQEEIAASLSSSVSGASSPAFDLAKLTSQPLLQSVYAETLRLRVAVVLMRSPEKHDFRLEDYLFKRGSLIFLCSAVAHRNKDVWAPPPGFTEGGLNEFWPERFLVYDSDGQSGPTKNGAGTMDGHIEKKGKARFSMEGTNGAFVPYGGGARMCPGRFFAKNEMLASLAMLVRSYDFELLMGHNWKPEPDMNYYLVGVLPPKGPIKFRVRRRIQNATHG